MSVHPDAQREFDEIENMSRDALQRAVAARAFADAWSACLALNLSSLTYCQPPSSCKVVLRYASVTAKRAPAVGGSVEGMAVAGDFSDSRGRRTMQVLACDVTGSGWWHGPDDPRVRAARRVP